MPTDQDYIALLAAADDPARFEFPKGYDWQAAKFRFGHFADDLDAALGIKADRDTSVEDASHLAEYFIPPDLLTAPVDPYTVGVLISNWGNFALVPHAAPWLEQPEGHVKPEVLQTIDQVLKNHGYTLIPNHIIWTPYTGPWAKHFEDPVTWYSRYFDYG